MAFECEIKSISTSTDCNQRAGIKRLYLGLYNSFNWVAIAAALDAESALNTWDPSWYDSGLSTLTEWSFERQGAFYRQSFTDDTDQYEQLVTIILNGKNSARVDALRKAVLCCQMAGFVFYNSGPGRLIGVDYDGDIFDLPIEALHISRHDDDSGTIGDTLARDEVDLGGSTFNTSLWVDAAVQNSLAGTVLTSTFAVQAVAAIDNTGSQIANIASIAINGGTYTLKSQSIALANLSGADSVFFTFTVNGEVKASAPIALSAGATSVTIPDITIGNVPASGTAAITLDMEVVGAETVDTVGGENLTILEF